MPIDANTADALCTILLNALDDEREYVTTPYAHFEHGSEWPLMLKSSAERWKLIAQHLATGGTSLSNIAPHIEFLERRAALATSSSQEEVAR